MMCGRPTSGIGNPPLLRQMEAPPRKPHGKGVRVVRRFAAIATPRRVHGGAVTQQFELPDRGDA
jgi:hypothetical protein